MDSHIRQSGCVCLHRLVQTLSVLVSFLICNNFTLTFINSFCAGSREALPCASGAYLGRRPHKFPTRGRRGRNWVALSPVADRPFGVPPVEGRRRRRRRCYTFILHTQHFPAGPVKPAPHGDLVSLRAGPEDTEVCGSVHLSGREY